MSDAIRIWRFSDAPLEYREALQAGPAFDEDETAVIIHVPAAMKDDPPPLLWWLGFPGADTDLAIYGPDVRAGSAMSYCTAELPDGSRIALAWMGDDE